MLRGHLWRDSQRRSAATRLPSCWLTARLATGPSMGLLPATAAAHVRISRPDQIRWQSQARPPPPPPPPPSRYPQSPRPWQKEGGGPNRPFGGGTAPPGNLQQGREWGNLQRNSGPRRGKPPQGGGRDDGFLQQLTRNMASPGKTGSPSSLSSSLGFEPIRKGPPRSPRPFNNERAGPRQTGGFPSAFPRRDGPGGGQQTARTRGAGAGPRLDRRGGGFEAPDHKKTSTPAADGWEEEGYVSLEADPMFADIQPAAVEDDYAGSPFDHRRRERKSRKDRRDKDAERAARNKSKGRRNRAYEMEEDDYEELDERAEERRQRKEEKRRKREAEMEAARQGPVPILLPAFISVANLGTALRVKPHVFLRQLGELGFEEITLDSIMTGETAALVAQEYGFEPTVDSGESVDLRRQAVPADPSTLPERPPIVTIMGHVDHGKTTMLDWLRKSSVAAQEHGGITQHIGAFLVKLSGGKQITFLDTPGHAAFLSMRQRGANVTDIVILVVAADDSVKPQTLEALKHARAAHVPIIVAINKVDKDEARVEQVKSDLARHGVEIEDYGGDVQVVCVSGRTGQGMADLEENIVTLAEMLDVRADPGGMVEGWVLESSVKDRVGRAASVLVKRGTLRRGDIIVAGMTWARVRVLRNEAGTEVDEAAPGTPVEVLGWRELPDAGDEVLQAPTEARAREATEYRLETQERGQAAASEQERQAAEVAKETAKEAEAAKTDAEKAADETDAEGAAEASGPAVVNFLIKADVTGSVEAVDAAVSEIGNHEVRPHILRAAPGPVTESDVEHAATTGSTIISFHSATVPGHIRRLAKNAGVPLLEYAVIYHLIDEVKARLSQHLAPTVTTRVLGEAEVLQVFPINVRGRVFHNIAGCRVRNGQITRGGQYRVYRKGEKVFDGKLESLKQGKKDASEMRKGTECGISFEEWDDIAVGDTIQAYEEIREKRTL